MLSGSRRASLARVSDERGSIIVAAGIMSVAFLLMGAVVLQVGQWLQHRRSIQARADSAALAAGQQLAACFNIGINGTTEASVDSSVESWAKSYGGISGGASAGAGYPYNNQFGHAAGNLMSFQSDTYPSSGNTNPGATTGLDGRSPADSHECVDSHGNPNLWLDVKMSQQGISSLFSFAPLATVHGHARVQLQQIQSLNPTLPFAIPDVRVKVAVTFVNNATGAALAGCPNGCVFPLSATGQSNGLNTFGTTATIPQAAWPAANSLVGMRVALGNTPGSCAAGVNPTTYECFDDNSNNGLVALRSYAATTGTQAAPVLQKVTPTTCSGNPFFSDNWTTTGSCNSGVTATVNWGASGPPANAHVRATVNGTNLALAPDGNPNEWSSPAVALSTVQGAYPVTMSWCVGTCKKAYSAFNSGNPVQLIFSGSDNPILAVSVLGPSADNSYSFLAGQGETLNVAVGLSNGVHLPTRCSNGTSGGNYSCASDPPVLLRNPLGNGNNNDSLTFAISCGGNLRSDIENGCTTPYQINVPDVCPDPANPNPIDCATSANGQSVGQLVQGMNYRFTVNHDSNTCDPNNYPNVPPGDPRAVTLIITDWNAFQGSGKTTVPVVSFATFYVTGWDGAPNSCTTGANPPNEPDPPGATKKSSVWGHYIADVNIGATPNGTACVPPGQTLGTVPCAIALTR